MKWKEIVGPINERKIESKVTQVVEYEDMTDHQKMICDAKPAPKEDQFPPNLSKEELEIWFKKKLGLS